MYTDACYDIQLDPVRQRIFLIGAPDTNSVCVLRDTDTPQSVHRRQMVCLWLQACSTNGLGRMRHSVFPRCAGPC